MTIGSRKLDHLEISTDEKVQSKVQNGFDDVSFIHRALPEINIDEVDVKSSLVSKTIDAPIMIAGMTGGHKKAEIINKNLALAAEELGIPMGVGSQRAGIEDKNLVYTYSVARKAAPSAFIIGNLGMAQFSNDYSVEEAKKAVDMIEADALAIHLNALHEAVQPLGDVKFKACLDAVRKLKEVGVPLIAKETGAGISMEDAALLEEAGVNAIDVGGLGGTSFPAIEHYRIGKKNTLGKLFGDWGIPTAVSTVECSTVVKIDVISTGGIRNGLQIAKALALGATCCGIAMPLLRKSKLGSKEVVKDINRIIEELKTAMFLVGAKTIDDLRKSNLIITGNTREWLDLRGIECKQFANRRR
jgi:isopentenyl-diphosphate delta-isomerase